MTDHSNDPVLTAARRRRVLVAYESYITSTFLCWDYPRAKLEAATGRDWVLTPVEEADPESLDSFHAVIVARGISERSLALLRAARRAGCRTLYDSDDNLLLIHQAISDPDHVWRRIFGEARPRIEAMLAEANVVKIYSNAATPFFRRYNERVAVIAPYQIVDRDALPPFSERDWLTVGFIGSYFKDEEFAPVVRAIERLIADRHALRFQFFGFLPPALATRPHVSHVPWVSSYLDFRRRFAALEWDVGVAPLRDLEFNRAKTNNKYREYAAAGIVGIYSDVEVYRSSVAHGVTGLIVAQEDEHAWYDAVVRLLREPALRATIRRRAFEDVRANYRVDDYVARVADLLEGEWPPPAARG